MKIIEALNRLSCNSRYGCTDTQFDPNELKNILGDSIEISIVNPRQVKDNIYPTRIIMGREYGLEMREKFDLDTFDHIDRQMFFYVPSHVFTVNASFVRGLLSQSFTNVGAKVVESKYKFIASERPRTGWDEDIIYILEMMGRGQKMFNSAFMTIEDISKNLLNGNF